MKIMILYIVILGVLLDFGSTDRMKILAAAQENQPNIILVLTDDQGYEDVGYTGNRDINTPNIDQLAAGGIQLNRFYVAPVCSPTRAGIMTGRYHYRTGVTNVGSCGDRMKASEVTIAEAFRDGGYATAIYGKWHLGDNYPMRPHDNGFEEAIVHLGCCLTPWFRNDPPGANYYDPFLWHNGEMKQYSGFCMDVYTDLTIEFARKNLEQNKAFFIYLSTNTPHGPLTVPAKYSEPYKNLGISDHAAEYYGTIANIDYNIGRLMNELKKMEIDRNTIVVFLTDNGAAANSARIWPRMLRGKKASVYEGGIRVPCVVHWPAEITPGTETDRISAYIDLMPTLLDAAGIAQPAGVNFDGVSLLPLLKDPSRDVPERDIVIQWHQGLTPQIFRSFAIFNQRYKLVQGHGGSHRSGKFLADEFRYELFDIIQDPFEKNDISADNPDIVESMKSGYENWYWDVIKSRGPDPEQIHIGSAAENPVRLYRSGSFVEQDEVPNYVTGEWPARIIQSGKYNIKIVYPKGLESDGTLQFRFGKRTIKSDVAAGITEHVFSDVELAAGSDWLEAFVWSDKRRLVPTYIDIELQQD